MKLHPVCPAEEIRPGEKTIVEVEGKSIGIFNVGGEFFALRNICPHQFAPLCEGKVTGLCEPSPVGEFRWAREGEIIRCPWHAWEFDIKTGKSIFNPHKVRTKSYPVTVAPAGAGEEPTVETYPVMITENMVFLRMG